MALVHRRTASFCLNFAFLTLVCAVAQAAAQHHVVSVKDLRQEVVSAQTARRSHLNRVRAFFSCEAAQKALQKAHIDPALVEKVVPQLSDEELARLASRTDNVQRDFRAGALTNQQLTYIIIAIATALIVTLIFVAK